MTSEARMQSELAMDRHACQAAPSSSAILQEYTWMAGEGMERRAKGVWGGQRKRMRPRGTRWSVPSPDFELARQEDSPRRILERNDGNSSCPKEESLPESQLLVGSAQLTPESSAQHCVWDQHDNSLWAQAAPPWAEQLKGRVVVCWHRGWHENFILAAQYLCLNRTQ